MRCRDGVQRRPAYAAHASAAASARRLGACGEVLTVMRRELAKYRDIRAAEADGFRNYIRRALRRYCTSRRFVGHSRHGTDSIPPGHVTALPARGGRRSHPGRCDVHPPRRRRDRARRRLPLSIVRWHETSIGACRRWRMPGSAGGRRKTGSRSSVRSHRLQRQTRVRRSVGDFGPGFRLMVHVMAFSGDDPGMLATTSVA